MTDPCHIVVCGSLVPDPLQTLEPVAGPAGPALRNEMMLPSVLDPWAAHALYEAASLASTVPGSKVWLVSMGPKARLQQLMMTVAQKAAFELVAIDGPAGGFVDAHDTADALAAAIAGIADLDRSRFLLFTGCASASRDAGVTLQLVAERLALTDVFLEVDELSPTDEGAWRVLERADEGGYLVSEIDGPPMAVGWATGHLPEPPNNPQLGMQNMRTIMPALARATPAPAPAGDMTLSTAVVPTQQRETRIVRDATEDEIASEIVAWLSN